MMVKRLIFVLFSGCLVWYSLHGRLGSPDPNDCRVWGADQSGAPSVEETVASAELAGFCQQILAMEAQLKHGWTRV